MSLTVSAYHDRFVQQNPSIPHGQYLHQPWLQCLAMYRQRGWRLCKTAYRQKIPLNGISWPKEDVLSVQGRAEDWVLGKMVGNLAVILGPSKLVSIDIDDPVLPKKIAKLTKKTLTMRTSRAYQSFIQSQGPEADQAFTQKIREAYEDYTRIDSKGREKAMLEAWWGDRYSVIPMSVTCTRDKGQGHPAPRRQDGSRLLCHDQQLHDYRVREWIDMNQSTITINEAEKILL